jgi:hypothetical protein
VFPGEGGRLDGSALQVQAWMGHADSRTRMRYFSKDTLLKPAEAAKLLAVRPSWIYDAVRNGRLPAMSSDGQELP